MTLHEALRDAVCEAAEALGLPLVWAGEGGTPPLAPHLRAKIVCAARAASCGAKGLTRVDGSLELIVFGAADAPAGLAGLAGLALRVAGRFPRGSSVFCEHGEAVFAEPHTSAAKTKSGRPRVAVSVPFYALTSPSPDNLSRRIL